MLEEIISKTYGVHIIEIRMKYCQAWFTSRMKVHGIWLRDVQTCETILALAYMLYCLSTV